MAKKDPLRRPWRVFAKNDVVEIQDGKGRAIVHWAGFDASSLPLRRHARAARVIVRAVNSLTNPQQVKP